jgi:DNA-binding transcriptional MerR regulator
MASARAHGSGGSTMTDTVEAADKELSQRTTPAEAEMGFTGRRAAEIVGITYRQLDYWARTDLVRPSLVDAAGSGSRRSYSYKDLLELKVIKSLLDAGIKLEQVRTVFGYLRDQLGEDVASTNLVISGTKSVLVRDGAELIDVLKAGQGVLNILPLAQVKDDVDAKVLEFPPTQSGTAAPAADVVEAGTDSDAAAGAV